MPTTSLFDSIATPRDWISLGAAASHLSLAVTALISGRRSQLGRPLAALCFVLFGWNFATLAHHLASRMGASSTALVAFDAFFTALSPPLVLEVVLAFVGQARLHRTARVHAWIAFGGIALASLAGLASESALAWQEAPAWSLAFLVAWLPALLFEITVLGRYLASTTDLREKARARTVLAAVAIGGIFGASDLAHGVGLPLPYLGALGTLIAAALLTTLVLRLELFDRNVSARMVLYALTMIAAFVVAYLVVLSVFAGSLAAQVFGVAVVTLLCVAVARELVVSVAEHRARTERLAALGRFSAQMAHDIKGPLTALLGAVQVLDGVDEGADHGETRREFLGLVSDQAKRIASIVDRYDRMGRVEPRKTLVRLDEIARTVARAHRVDAIELGAGLDCEADRELVESAIENIVRNAVEATGDASAVRVETAVDRERRAVLVRVIDRGPGMDARHLERALEDFFTTKANGSGLGLAFVRRVMVAHGGELVLRSRPGEGTLVELRLPL